MEGFHCDHAKSLANRKAPVCGGGCMCALAEIERSDLAGVVLHHQQFVDLEGDPLALALADHLGHLLVLVELQVGRDVG